MLKYEKIPFRSAGGGFSAPGGGGEERGAMKCGYRPEGATDPAMQFRSGLGDGSQHQDGIKSLPAVQSLFEGMY